VIRTARANVILLKCPSWVAGLLFPFLLLGLAGWKSPVGARAALTVGLYAVAFLFAGRSYHSYWGLVYSSLLPLGLSLSQGPARSLPRPAARTLAADCGIVDVTLSEPRLATRSRWRSRAVRERPPVM